MAPLPTVALLFVVAVLSARVQAQNLNFNLQSLEDFSSERNNFGGNSRDRSFEVNDDVDDDRDDSDETVLRVQGSAVVTGGSVRQQVFPQRVQDSDEFTVVPVARPGVPVQVYGAPPSYQAPAPAPAYQAPDDSGEAPAQSYQAPNYEPYDQCKPIVQYSVVTHQVFVPTTKEVYHTKYLPTTEFAQLVETKYYGQSQVDVVTVTAVPEPQFLTKTEVVTNPVYFARTQYSTLTKYATATQLEQVTQTKIAVITKYVTKTQVQYETQVQYQTETAYVTQYQTQVQYQTKTEYRPQYLTQTETQQVPVYVTKTEVEQQYVTQRVPAYQTVVQTKQVTQYATVTTPYPVYSTVVSTQYQQQYATVTVTKECQMGGYY